MAIDQENAASSLNDVARMEKRTLELVRYSYASGYQLLWGILVAIGYVAQYLRPESGIFIWAIVIVSGVLGGVVFRIGRARSTGRPADYRWVWGQLAVVAFGMLWTGVFTDATPRQLSALWPSFFMFWMVIFGIFFGRFYVMLGLIVTALTTIVYLWSGDLFLPCMAVIVGGALIASGLYLRRIGLTQ